MWQRAHDRTCALTHVHARARAIGEQLVIFSCARHYTMVQNSLILRHKPFTFPRAREWVSKRANELVQRSTWVERTVWHIQMSEWYERTDERVAQYFRLDSWLFWTTVHYVSENQSTGITHILHQVISHWLTKWMFSFCVQMNFSK